MDSDIARKILQRRSLLLLYALLEDWPKRRSRFWVHPLNTVFSRSKQGDHQNLLEEMRLTDINKYFNHLRMTPDLFETLLSLVGPQISKLYVHREPLTPSLKLSLTLRYLASGDSMVSIARQFRIGESTTSKVIRDTCNKIWDILKDITLVTPTTEDWKQSAKSFNEKWNFPNCVAALDGKHVVITAPAHSGSSYYNYKGSHSVVLMAMCDAHYNFMIVDIGAQGRFSDGGIFKNSIMGQRFNNNEMDLPEPSQISVNRPSLPYIVVADEAFPLTSYMLRPYPGKNLTPSRRVFNYRLSRSRRCIENAFGILAGRWRIYRKPIIASLETVDAIIKSTVVLHNFIKKYEAKQPNSNRRYCPTNFIDTEKENGTLVPGDWRNIDSNGLQDICRTGTNYYSSNVSDIREEFMDFFIDEGEVPFQWNKI